MCLLLAFLAARHFLYSPWFTPPSSEDTTMRVLCRGWSCGAPKDLFDSSDGLMKIAQEFKNGTLEGSLLDATRKLVSNGFVPASCALAAWKALGMGGDPQNLSDSLQILRDNDFWSCHEILAFHPDVAPDERARHLELAASQGSVYAMQKIALDTRNLSLYRHLLFAMTGGWYRRHDGTPEFAKLARAIFTHERADAEWEEMFARAAAGNVPSAAWVVDGFLSGKLAKGVEEVEPVLRTVIENGPWRFDAGEVVWGRDKVNKTAMLQFMANAGDAVSRVYLSYPELYM